MILKFFNKEDKSNNDSDLINVACLMIHAAKIDENYSENERKLIKNFMKSYLKDVDAEKLLIESEEIEKNSNQLLNFTNIIKKNSMEVKKDIIEHLWKIVISDNSVDQYESNLMRRISGLIYVPDKVCAEIKLKLINT